MFWLKMIGANERIFGAELVRSAKVYPNFSPVRILGNFKELILSAFTPSPRFAPHYLTLTCEKRL